MITTLDQMLEEGLDKINNAPLSEVYRMPQAQHHNHKVFKEAIGLITPQMIAKERREIFQAGLKYREEHAKRAAAAEMHALQA